MKELLLVGACALIDTDGRILMCQRPAGKMFAGKWEFPGGKIEKGERPEQAIVRELREELALEPCEQCLQAFAFSSYSYDDKFRFSAGRCAAGSRDKRSFTLWT